MSNPRGEWKFGDRAPSSLRYMQVIWSADTAQIRPGKAYDSSLRDKVETSDYSDFESGREP